MKNNNTPSSNALGKLKRLDYHSQNVLLIALTIMELLVLIKRNVSNDLQKNETKIIVYTAEQIIEQRQKVKKKLNRIYHLWATT